MKKLFNLKKISLTCVFILTLLLLGTTNSKAVLQANPTTHANPIRKKGSAWITEIRQMETANQTMGLTETLNGRDATSVSNNIDVHMMLPTEYGAIAILSASGYGNSKQLRESNTDAQKRTTTGNSTGVYFTGDRWEITATRELQAGDGGKYLKLYDYDRRKAKFFAGDALGGPTDQNPGCYNWHYGRHDEVYLLSTSSRVSSSLAIGKFRLILWRWRLYGV